jgi:Flp pilus assembly protein TadD
MSALEEFNHALVQYRTGKPVEAAAGFQRCLALDPLSHTACCGLGDALRDMGRFTDAIAAYQRGLSMQPDHVPSLDGLAVTLGLLNRPAQAVSLLRRAVELEPNDFQLHHNLAIALRNMGQTGEAIATLRRAAALGPDAAEPHHELAMLLYLSGDIDGAIASYRSALRYGDAPEIHNNLGAALQAAGDIPGAAAEYRKAVDLRPDYHEAHDNLGAVLRLLERFDEAEAAFLRALELRPDYASAHWNLARLRLMRGDWAGGWPEYDWRWKVREFNPPQVLSSKPRWDGGDLNGKRILLYTEQGFGDTIHFARYVPLAAQRGGKVLLYCQPELLPLLKGVAGVDAAAAVGQHVPESDFDVHFPLLSLPGLFKTTLDNVPADVPYIRAAPAAVERWRSRVPADGRRKIGLVWTGGPKPPGRSVTPAMLAGLAEAGNAWFCSLQKDYEPGSVLGGMEIADWPDETKDFFNTAALIENLDLVISVDTSVAHLAGAMGKPVWVLLKWEADWRWMLDRADTPWYPTMRLFRQKTPGDWTAPISELASALKQL